MLRTLAGSYLEWEIAGTKSSGAGDPGAIIADTIGCEHEGLRDVPNVDNTIESLAPRISEQLREQRHVQISRVAVAVNRRAAKAGRPLLSHA